MARRSYTDDEKAHALACYVERGPAEAARQTGIAEGTIASWAHREGIASVATEQTNAATEARLATIDERKTALAADLMGDIERLRTQLFAPCTGRKVVTLSGGKTASATWEIVDVDLDQPTFGDQRQIMTSIAIAVDKVQILTGAATERIDMRHTTPIDEELEQLTAELASQAAT